MIVFAGAMTITTGCGGQQQQGPQGGAPAYATMVLTPTNSALETTYPALIKGKTDIAIRPQVTGFITKVHVDEGQQVRKGQTLFTLDQVQFNAAVEQAQAAVNAAKTAVATAQLTANSKRELLNKNIISNYEYQLADNQLQTAKAQLAQSEAALTTARKNLAFTVVTAPSDGVVGRIPNREGSLASPTSAEPLTTVSDNSEVYAYFSLTEKDLLEMSDNGQRSIKSAIDSMPAVKLRLADGSIYPIEGKVATVSGVIDNSTGAASVRALFNNPSGILRSGATGNIVMPRDEENVIVIPQKATFELQDKKFVFVVNDSNIVRSTPITIAPVNDGKNYVVTSGLKAGDRIAIEGVGTSVRDGMTITPTDPNAAAAQTAPEGRPN
ncbi:MAG: efflux RND transporter periplasmic adaptor subunit [Muribaculaceae bacterium]|nr:efflux RND transporter periplasmic adaptor subunit [Muribaculaceae bacterium]